MSNLLQRRLMNFINNLTDKQKRIYEILLAVLILFTIFFMRGYKLDADPPIGLSVSTDVYTDPTQYTLFAKQKVLTDDFNPYNETRFVFFLKSSVTLLALLIFKIFGVTVEASNFVGLFYSFCGLLLFYLIIRKIANPLAGFLYLILIAINYNQIFFGRLPFLEHAMIFYAFLSLALLTYCKKIFWYILAGASLAVGIFFGKVIGLVFLAPFFGYFVYQYIIEDKKNVKEFIAFSLGFSAIVIFWYSFSYLPLQSQVSSYVGEQAISLYGTPEAFDSFDNFIWKYLSLGNDSKLFTRMRIPWVLSAFFTCLFLFKFFDKGKLKEKLQSLNSGQFFLILMMISFYGALMIWNYRPLRYQLVLIYPVYATASILLAQFFAKRTEPNTNKVPTMYLPTLFLVFYPLVYQFYGYYIDQSDGAFYYDSYKYVVTAWALFVAFVFYGAIILYRKYQNLIPQNVLKVIPLIIVASIYFFNIGGYLYWSERPTFTAKDNSQDFGQIISPSAVVSGPYACAFTVENKIGTIIHMFGVSEADTNFFKNEPITHLLLDEGNEIRAKEDYPYLMDSAKLIMTYHVGLKKVRLYRIAGYTGNQIADNYQLSPYEQLVEQYDDGKGTINNDLAVEIISKNPDNIACYTFLAEAAEIDSIYQLSEMMFKKAVEFSPTNYNLNARLAKYYQDRFNESNDVTYKAKSKFYYEQAIKYAPTTTSLLSKLNELDGN